MASKKPRRAPGSKDEPRVLKLDPADVFPSDALGLLDPIVEKSLEKLNKLVCVDEKKQRRAQEHVYSAMESESPDDVVDHVTQALKLDPFNVDARLMLVDIVDPPLQERLDFLDEAIQQAEMSLGRKFFRKNCGYFWGLLETRPYMRGRAMLATTLIEAKRWAEAIFEIEGCLQLNPNDNQGLRYLLLGCLLIEEDTDRAAALIARYDEASAVILWGQVLLHLLVDDNDAAEAALQAARQDNPYVEAYLTGLKRVPDDHPAFYSLGDESEAQFCANCIGAAWRKQRAAVKWLKARAV